MPIFTPSDGKSGAHETGIVTKLAKINLKDTRDIILTMLRYSVVICCVFERVLPVPVAMDNIGHAFLISELNLIV